MERGAFLNLTIHFLFNLSLLVVLLFVSLLLIEKVRKTPTIDILYFTVSLLICFSFSYSWPEDILLDLRGIPIIIGSLYAGLGPLLGVLAIAIRALSGFDTGFWLSLVFFTFSIILFEKARPWFLGLKPKQRVFWVTFFTAIMSLTQGLPLFNLKQFNEDMDLFLAFMVIQPLGAGMIAYFIEEIDKILGYRKRLLSINNKELVEKMGAAISHEIRNPLTAASGFVQLLQSDHISEKARSQYLSIVKSELKSAEKVIEDYLALPKENEYSINTILVNEELSKVIKTIKLSAYKNNVAVKTKFSNETMILGDRQKFYQSLFNLMKNAIEAMPKGGTLTVQTYTTPSNVTISISDTGEGMSEDQLNRLGEPYFSTKGEKGTGLGVMVVFSVIQAMNGKIHVESKKNMGTTFEITFSSSLAVFETKDKEDVTDFVSN